MALEVYIASSEPSPRVKVVEVEKGDKYTILNLLMGDIEVIAIACDDRGAGEVFSTTMRNTPRSSIDLKEVVRSEHFAGHVHGDLPYEQKLVSGSVFVTHVDRESPKSTKWPPTFGNLGRL